MAAGHADIEDKVGRVTRRRQDPSPLARLVHGAEVVLEHAELGDLHGHHPEDGHGRKQDLRT